LSAVVAARPAAAPAGEAQRSGFLSERIVHVHPTRLCNLACRHCYSHSSPRQRGELAAALILGGFALLRREGYTQVSLSGGEPLVYRELLALIDGARVLGLRVTMVSNGLLVDARAEAALSRLHGLAISFDGLARTHNAVRGRDDAYARACGALRYQASRGRPTAAAISLARDALSELPDLVDELLDCGARAFQIRPVARAGRAKGLPGRCFYSDADQARLVLVINALRQELPGVPIHCDLVPARSLWRQRADYSGLLASSAASAPLPLAELVNPLVITDDSTLKPIAYDFASRFDIATLHTLDDDATQRYKRGRLNDLRALVQDALSGLADRNGFVDWFDHCTRMSELQTPVCQGV
jgi:pyruvate-formate lyase-activating enzyme